MAARRVELAAHCIRSSAAKADGRAKAAGRLRVWERNDAVRKALGDDQIPVRCALSFVDAEWPLLFAKPFQLQEVWVSWPAKLTELITAQQVLSDSDVEAMGRLLSEKLPGYSG